MADSAASAVNARTVADSRRGVGDGSIDSFAAQAVVGPCWRDGSISLMTGGSAVIACCVE